MTAVSSALTNSALREETIVADGSDMLYLGPSLTLEHCKIVLSTTWRAFIVSGVRFLDCEFVAKKKFTRYQWDKALFRNCRFSGTFAENDFGPWEGVDFQAGAENCDFSGAILVDCRVLGDTGRTNRFPKWPCFTIFDPIARLDELRKIDWPGEMDGVIDSLAMSPKNLTAATFHFPKLAKEFKLAEEDLRRALTQAGDVFF